MTISDEPAPSDRPIWPALGSDPVDADRPGGSTPLGADQPKSASGASTGGVRPELIPAASNAAPAAAAAPTGPPNDRVVAALDLWRKKLLDLTKRNRALNFKPSKVSTVTIVDEQPVEVFKHLCIDEKPMRFAPALAPQDGLRVRAETAAGATESPDELELDSTGSPGDSQAELMLIDSSGTDEPDAPELDFAPYDPSGLDERHRDDILQTQSAPEALDKSLRRLDEQARATLEEQGANTLFLALGMLHYAESADSDVVLKAPLIMVPVSLSRRSARSEYTVWPTDEDAMVNPALAEYLRRTFGISLPELPSADDPGAEQALQAFYVAASQAAAERERNGFKGWAVKTDIFLGFFAFQKLVMFKDLEVNNSAFSGHRLVRQLVTRESKEGSFFMGLPADIRDLNLDEQFAPEGSAQVVDADASQLRAIAAVAKGNDLVVEGPPGTGKSQTITNLIAQALSDGKSVLFVAEKMAALQVVQRRLRNAGLGEFCLELHASKANKRLVMQELKSALDASLQRPTLTRRTHRLPSVRGMLSEYANAVHTPYGTLAISPFRATGLLEGVLDAPRLPFKRAVDDLTLETVHDTSVLLGDLAVAQTHVGVPADHPWRDTGRTFYTPGALEDLKAELSALDALLTRIERAADQVEKAFSLPLVRTAEGVATAGRIAAVFERSPGAPISVLESDAWNAPPREAAELVDRVRTLQRWRQEIDSRFVPDVCDSDHSADIGYVESKASGVFGFLAVLDGRFRAIKRRWATYRTATYAPKLLDQATALKLVDRYRASRNRLEASEGKAVELFGPAWKGERSDVSQLERYMAWVVELRSLCVRYGLSADTLRPATKPKPDVSLIRELESTAFALQAPLAALTNAVDWPREYFASASYSQIRTRLQEMHARISGAIPWAGFQQALGKAIASPAVELVALAMNNSGAPTDVPFDKLGPSFRRAVLERWLENVMSERTPLREFKTLSHEDRIKEFRQLDEWVLKENQAAVVGNLRGAAQERLQAPAARAGLPFLQGQMARQRNIAPLRTLLKHAEPTVRAIKPCFLMSPLTVAQLLDGRAPTFDLVIFDEASQLPSEDAIGAICRGKQLVVVGDPKQLPPTTFFAAAPTVASQMPVDDGGMPLIQDGESVLEEYMGAGVPATRLKWHYRSAHESLITFSNVTFYDSGLYTFPSVETGSDRVGVSFEFVEGGVYEGKGLNRIEARRVADAVVRHAKQRPHESLGVGTFNMRQQLAVQDELELRRRQDPSLEPFFARGSSENFFVKNLENIQGDERDVIFLSVTYAKGDDGRLRYNFGPINGENGWRRLNVLTTRARKRMRVFSSIRGDDINAAGTTARGAQLLREFLFYAERGRLDSAVASAVAASDSPFEAQVIAELTRRGIRVVPQVGASGYRIDIGVLDDEVEGRFICGIECDGVAYHSSETARDRDRLRQQVLEARGWIIHRVWSTDWFKDRAGQVNRLLRLVEEARAETRERMNAEAADDVRAREVAEEERRQGEARAAADSARGSLNGVFRSSYVRPSAAPYTFAEGQGRFAGSDLLETPMSHVAAAIIGIVEVEGPIHTDILASRTAAMWGVARVGSRIAAKVNQAVDQAVRGGSVVRRGEFLWSKQAASDPTAVPVRSRTGTRLTGLHVPPEEVSAAIRLVLTAAGGLTRDELLGEVRQVLGVGKGILAQAFEDAVTRALRDGTIGEGSAGLAMRQ